MTHPFLFKNNKYEIKTNKEQIKNIINLNITNHKSPTTVKLFRPPYGFRIPATMKVTKQLNLTTVLWDVFPRDYKSTSEQIIKRTISKTKSGSIICLHDGPSNRNETLKALPVIITELKEKGFKFVSLSELEDS